jgi:hypothetical protein
LDKPGEQRWRREREEGHENKETKGQRRMMTMRMRRKKKRKEKKEREAVEAGDRRESYRPAVGRCCAGDRESSDGCWPTPSSCLRSRREMEEKQRVNGLEMGGGRDGGGTNKTNQGTNE